MYVRICGNARDIQIYMMKKRFLTKVASTILFLQIPIVSPAEAADLASKYRKQGFTMLKLKVGKNLKQDIEVLQAIRKVHPDCSFILDANEGYKPVEAIKVLEQLYGSVLQKSQHDQCDIIF